MTAPLHAPAPTGRAPLEDDSTPPPTRPLPPPPPPPPPSEAPAAAIAATTASSSSLGASATTGEFPLFAQLPTEIRLQIWRAALPPRTVELHSGRYSSHYARSTPGPWHSSSGNPAPLAACAEARQEALRRYTVALPVVSPAGLRDFGGKPPPSSCPNHDHDHDHIARPPPNPERRLYLDPVRDTLVILGALEYRRLEALRAQVARQDARGLRRLALTTGGFTRGSAGPELRVWARVLLAGLDQFTLLLHDARWPPEGARGGHVAVAPCGPDDRLYAAFVTSHRQYLGAGAGGDGGWMVVGCQGRRMRVGLLEFVRDDGVRIG